MTTKEKAKRYDEAIERANELNYVSDKDSLQRKTVEHIFPELAESEDEKIRKELINFCKIVATGQSSILIEDANQFNRWAAWLEKQGEQKPVTQHSTEWSVSDFRTWQYIVSDVLTKKDGIGQYLDSGECKKIAKYMQEEWGEKLGKEQTQEELCKGEDYGIDGLYHAISILEKTLGKVDGYQSDDGILEHKCAINAVKELYEQNPAWSEEDEKMWAQVINEIEAIKSNSSTVFEKNIAQDKIDWLKSLKDRYTWKPSKEQIIALRWVLSNIPYNIHKEEISRLLDHIKEL